MFSFGGIAEEDREIEGLLKDEDRRGVYEQRGRRSAMYVDVGDVRILDIPIPITMERDSKSYLKCTPLASLVKLSLTGQARRMINDVASNVGIIDEDVFYKNYPMVRVDTSIQIAIQGIGKERTKGWAVIPIYLQGMDTKLGTPCTVRTYIEVHLIWDFKPGLLIGLDVITDYGIQVDIQGGKASIPHQQFEYTLETGRSPRSSVLVKVAKAMEILG